MSKIGEMQSLKLGIFIVFPNYQVAREEKHCCTRVDSCDCQKGVKTENKIIFKSHPMSIAALYILAIHNS